MSSDGNLEAVPSERAQRQRERILEAARLSFVKRGFHGASIADIATEAGMSPGLMYRYFENKNAIIKAIIDRQLEFGRKKLEEIQSADDLVQGILVAIDQWHSGSADQMSAPLFLEISAEAMRDTEIAATVREADTLIKNHLRDAMRRTTSSRTLFKERRRADARVMLLISVIEGLAVRSCREADLDRDLLRNVLTDLVAGMQNE